MVVPLLLSVVVVVGAAGMSMKSLLFRFDETIG